MGGGDHRNEIELAVAGPAVSPAGRGTGDGTYGAQTTGPAARPSATTTARKILRQACHILNELGDDALTAA